MKHSSHINNQPFFSKEWLKPIMHSSNDFSHKNMGIEFEFFGYDAQTWAPLGTEGATLCPQDLLCIIASNESGAILLKDKVNSVVTGVKFTDGSNFSLEPGGQIEFSSKPTNNLKDLAQNVYWGLNLLENASQNKVVFLSHGTNPIAAPDHPLVVPKYRYQLMTRYFQSASVPLRAIDMMRYTATVQPNLDFAKSNDWHGAIKLILQLVPITNQLFANSKFFHGKKSVYPSERQNIWQKMDPTRSGFPTGLLEAENCPTTEHAYADWAKNAYVIFVDSLKGDEQPLYGELTFEQWCSNGYRGVFPDFKDWDTHLGSLFPHLRLRDFLEIRNIDAQPLEHTFAPMVFYQALLQNKQTQEMAWQVLSEFDCDTTDLHQLTQDFTSLFNPLLNLAIEILTEKNDEIGVISLQEFKHYLQTKNQDINQYTGLEFVKKHATFAPAQAFRKYLRSFI